MLVWQNLDWNQVLVSLKSNCKGCDGFAVLVKVFHEQVSMCWPSCISVASVMVRCSVFLLLLFSVPTRGRSTRHGSIKSSFAT